MNSNSSIETDVKIPWSYFLRGTRKYVQGKEIFGSFLKVLEQKGVSQFNIREIKFPQELYTNGSISISNIKNVPKSPSANINGLMSFQYNENICAIYVTSEEESPITEIKEDSLNPFIKHFEAAKDYAGMGLCHGISTFAELMSTIVDINKRAHIETLNETGKTYKIIWTYLKKFPIQNRLEFPDELLIKVRHIGHKKNSHGEVYTLNRIVLKLGALDYAAEMCYTFVEREK